MFGNGTLSKFFQAVFAQQAREIFFPVPIEGDKCFRQRFLVSDIDQKPVGWIDDSLRTATARRDDGQPLSQSLDENDAESFVAAGQYEGIALIHQFQDFFVFQTTFKDNVVFQSQIFCQTVQLEFFVAAAADFQLQVRIGFDCFGKGGQQDVVAFFMLQVCDRAEGKVLGGGIDGKDDR